MTIQVFFGRSINEERIITVGSLFSLFVLFCERKL